MLPALILNYFGQGATILWPTCFAGLALLRQAPRLGALSAGRAGHRRHRHRSQAVISGVYSITRQAVQLGQLPRMEIRHTSATNLGQIYVPRINANLCVGVVLIVLIFGTRMRWPQPTASR